jgi:hypothetical protein
MPSKKNQRKNQESNKIDFFSLNKMEACREKSSKNLLANPKALNTMLKNSHEAHDFLNQPYQIQSMAVGILIRFTTQRKVFSQHIDLSFFPKLVNMCIFEIEIAPSVADDPYSHLLYYMAYKRYLVFNKLFPVVLQDHCEAENKRVICVKRCVTAAILNVKRSYFTPPQESTRADDTPPTAPEEDERQRARRERAEHERARRQKAATDALARDAQKAPEKPQAVHVPSPVVENAADKAARARAAVAARAAHAQRQTEKEDERIRQLEWGASMIEKGRLIQYGL